MRHLIFVATLLLAACLQAEEEDIGKVIVHYYGFEIERIAGIHEDEIENLGCRYRARSEHISSSLSPLKGEEPGYDAFDVRAKIDMAGIVYFVDRDGVARQGSNYFVLNKESFLKSLTLVGECE